MPEPWRHLGHPAVVAHRGYAAHYPENTVLALAAAVAGGVRFLEFDVQLTRDGVPVLLHDPDLERVANRPECALDMDWQQLREARVAESGRLGDRYAHLPVARLTEAVAHLSRWPESVSFVEIKRHSVERHGAELVVERVLAALDDARWPFVVISFEAGVVECARRRGCRLTGWVLRDYDAGHRERLARLAPDYVFCNVAKVPDDAALWHGPWHWVMYEIVAPSVAAHWRGRGATLVESMAPVELLTAAPFRSDAT